MLRGLGFRGLRFRVWGFRGLGFRGLLKVWAAKGGSAWGRQL